MKTQLATVVKVLIIFALIISFHDVNAQPGKVIDDIAEASSSGRAASKTAVKSSDALKRVSNSSMPARNVGTTGTNTTQKQAASYVQNSTGHSSFDRVATNTQKSPNSNAARREAMRQQKIPTSQQPTRQSRSASGMEYRYTTPKSGGGTQTKSVQNQTLDFNHKTKPHWEAGKTKVDDKGLVQDNRHGRAKLKNDKSKVNY